MTSPPDIPGLTWIPWADRPERGTALVWAPSYARREGYEPGRPYTASHFAVATIHPNITVVGGHFYFDQPTPHFFALLPEDSDQ